MEQNHLIDAATTSRVERWLNRSIVCVYLGIITAFVLLSFYALPQSDDFCAAEVVRSHGAFGAVKVRYVGWTGRYFSLAFISLLLDRFSLIQNFWAIGVVTLSTLFVAIWTFIRALAKQRFTQLQVFWASLTLFVVYLAGMPRPATAFYWLTGATSNQLSIILILFLLALLLRDNKQASLPKRAASLVGLCLLTLAAIGTYETPMLLLLYVLVIGTGVTFVLKHPNRWSWAVSLVVGLIGISIVLSAPGLAVRSNMFPNGHQLGLTIDYSLTNGIKWLSECWLSVTLLSISILFLPAAYVLAGQLRDLAGSRTRWLVCLPVFWVATAPLSFAPAFWAMGSGPPPRTLNSVYMFILVGWFSSIIVLLACYRQRPDSEQSPIVPHVLLQAAKVTLVVSLLGQGNFYTAVTDLKSCATPYHEAMSQRFELISQAKAINSKRVRVPSLPTNPPTMLFLENDITPDPEFWVNVAVAKYFDVESITIESTDDGIASSTAAR